MARQYTQEQLDKVYEKLPEELKEAIFSVETAEEIGDTCETYGITDERVGEVAKYVGHVLMGLILPQDFAATLQREAKLPQEIAEAIARDLNRLVFYPVKPALEQLHQMEIKVEAKVTTPQPQAKEPEQEQQQEDRPDDPYRETLE